MNDNWALYVALLFALGLFGAVYNWVVERLEQRGRDRGFTALLVAFGCLVTVGASALAIGVEDAITVLACFAASGTPMILGSLVRYIRERELEEESVRRRGSGWIYPFLAELAQEHSTALEALTEMDRIRRDGDD